MRDERKTVAELLAEMDSDPKHRATIAKQEDDRKQFLEALNKAAQPIVEGLRSAGVDIEVVGDLLDDGRKIELSAIPVLLEHVKRADYPDQIREILLRALGSPVARPYW